VKRKLGVAATAGALAAALILVLTACGGNDDSDGVASLTDTTGQSTTEGGQDSGGDGSGTVSEEEREEAALEYAQCMREHGIDMPDPVNGRFELSSTPGDQEDLEEAEEACGDILQDVAPQLSEEQESELQDATLEFARCMREHGIDFPDPEFEEGGGILMRMPEGTENDPKFDEAQEACQPILDDAQRAAGLPAPDGADPDVESGGGGS
jgi:hypothetical protein